jgi:hypothetical protein
MVVTWERAAPSRYWPMARRLGRVEKTTPFKYSLYEGQDVGEDSGSPVDFSYKPPFKFTGTLERLMVELKSSDTGTVARQ